MYENDHFDAYTWCIHMLQSFIWNCMHLYPLFFFLQFLKVASSPYFSSVSLYTPFVTWIYLPQNLKKGLKCTLLYKQKKFYATGVHCITFFGFCNITFIKYLNVPGYLVHFRCSKFRSVTICQFRICFLYQA